MHRLLPVLLMPLAIIAADPSTAAARHMPAQTKTQAEVNVLHNYTHVAYVADAWSG
jgi:hypothetical protein